ncbi:ABC transporter permease [Hymenobacter psychrophilus]|uniref:Putative ABC transport system permease protein n=1 Tax=Hymenobacter psychrophilus TaxID=651662 RepID=A0A1H3NJ27_9BACT|nr:ABC transporter permease [Hymenobacter psychrophilus]SDY88818.1 putative ABC transport system permease protein [Hymenobacter psychrophilus]
MIRHLLKLIWRRKAANSLLALELLLTFLVLFGLGCLVAGVGLAFRQPPGFTYKHVWTLRLATNNDTLPQEPTLLRLQRQLRQQPGVEAVSLAMYSTPFSEYVMNSTATVAGQPPLVVTEVETDDQFAALLKMPVLEGRWFDRRDEAAGLPPVIINQEMREAFFGNRPALGQRIRLQHSMNENEKMAGRVVGVVGSYRPGGDLAPPQPVVFRRRVPPADGTRMFSYTLLVKVKPGAGAALEQQLVRTVTAVTKTWTVSATPLTDSRALALQTSLAPLLAVGIVSAFLLLNVALGLFGMLWQAISQRRDEIGLRRALGATATAIGWQFVAETLVLTTLAVLPGLFVAAQFPLLGVLGVSAHVYLLGMALALVVLYGFTLLCTLQPSWLAARVQPAVALREE